MMIHEHPLLGEDEKKLRRWLEDPQMDVALQVLKGQVSILEIEALQTAMIDLTAMAAGSDLPMKAKEALASAAALRLAIRELESLVGRESFQIVKFV
jgi:hypothetical protein